MKVNPPLAMDQLPKLASDLERFAWIHQHLYVPAVCDTLDSLGYRDQAMHQRLRPLIRPIARSSGEHKPCRWMDTDYVIEMDPYGVEIEAIDSLKAGDVAVHWTNHGGTNAPWGELMSTVATAQRGSRLYLRQCRFAIAGVSSRYGFPVFYTGIRPLDSMGRGRLMAYDVPVHAAACWYARGSSSSRIMTESLSSPERWKKRCFGDLMRRPGRRMVPRRDLLAGDTLRVCVRPLRCFVIGIN